MDSVETMESKIKRILESTKNILNEGTNSLESIKRRSLCEKFRTTPTPKVKDVKDCIQIPILIEILQRLTFLDDTFDSYFITRKITPFIKNLEEIEYDKKNSSDLKTFFESLLPIVSYFEELYTLLYNESSYTCTNVQTCDDNRMMEIMLNRINCTTALRRLKEWYTKMDKLLEF